MMVCGSKIFKHLQTSNILLLFFWRYAGAGIQKTKSLNDQKFSPAEICSEIGILQILHYGQHEQENTGLMAPVQLILLVGLMRVGLLSGFEAVVLTG